LWCGSDRCVQPFPGAVEPLLADLRKLLAALPERERLLERGAAALQPTYDVGQLVTSLLVAHRVSRHGSEP
jgi:hypothetical protein